MPDKDEVDAEATANREAVRRAVMGYRAPRKRKNTAPVLNSGVADSAFGSSDVKR